MSQSECVTVRELLPDRVAGRLAAREAERVDAHVGSCSDCAAEIDLLRVLFETRVAVPAGLAERVIRAARADRRPRQRPWWGISAAAVAALALGIGMNSGGTPAATAPVPAFASELDAGDLWSGDDGLIAGAPSFEALSDEALLELLEELDGSAGGAA